MTTSLKDKIGGMFLFGWYDDRESERTQARSRASWLMDEMRCGSVILMGENITGPKQLRALTADLQSLARRSGLAPLLIATDQEGGKVSRLRHPPFAKTREPWVIAESGTPHDAYDAAKKIGQELRDHGINWDLAPVLDVNNNPKNPVIGHRSYSADPQIAAAFGMEAVRGFQEGAGVLACGKHFPGHGDVDVDSHLDLPVIDKSLDDLRALELRPFAAAIAAGIASVMTAHILLPQIDPDHPATLSKPILTDLLRDEMGFAGLIVTDCLQMQAISKRYGAGEAAVLAVKAGADVIISVSSRKTQRDIRDRILEAVQSGEISESRIDESLARLASTKKRLAQ